MTTENWTILGVLASIAGVYIGYLQLNRTPKANQKSGADSSNNSEDENETGRPSAWSGIMPKGTRYKVRSKKFNSLPAGPQTITLEYDPEGHAYPLNLKGKKARVEIQFTCQINNVFKAGFAGNEYAMNFLPAHFLTKARVILESFTINQLSNNRQVIGKQVLDELAPYFDQYGFKLQEVTIGAVSKIEEN